MILKRNKVIFCFIFLWLFCFDFTVCKATTYEYDDLNRITKIIYKDGSYEEYKYDKNGNIISCVKKDVAKSQEPEYTPKPSASSKPSAIPKPSASSKPSGSTSPTLKPTPKATPKPTYKLNKDKLTLQIGETYKLKVQHCNIKAKFESNNKKVVTVKNTSGEVKAKASGKAVITATVGKQKLTCHVTVKLNNTKIESVKSQKKGLVVKWKKIKGIKEYQVYRSTKDKNHFVLLKETKKNSFIDRQANKGKTYYYKVKCIAKDKEFNSNWSNIKGKDYK